MCVCVCVCAAFSNNCSNFVGIGASLYSSAVYDINYSFFAKYFTFNEGFDFQRSSKGVEWWPQKNAFHTFWKLYFFRWSIMYSSHGNQRIFFWEIFFFRCKDCCNTCVCPKFLHKNFISKIINLDDLIPYWLLKYCVLI